jgi:hypothetical protein
VSSPSSSSSTFRRSRLSLPLEPLAIIAFRPEPRRRSSFLVLSRSAKSIARPSLVHFHLAFRAPKNITHNRLYFLFTARKLNPIIAAQYLTATTATVKQSPQLSLSVPPCVFPTAERYRPSFLYIQPSTFYGFFSIASASPHLLLNCHSWLNFLVRGIFTPCHPL